MINVNTCGNFLRGKVVEMNTVKTRRNFPCGYFFVEMTWKFSTWKRGRNEHRIHAEIFNIEFTRKFSMWIFPRGDGMEIFYVEKTWK